MRTKPSLCVFALFTAGVLVSGAVLARGDGKPSPKLLAPLLETAPAPKDNLASADILIVWATIIWAAVAIWRYDRWVSLAQTPYFIWVSLATVLQLSMTAMNWR